MANSYILRCFLFCMIRYFARASHFLGGTISWQAFQPNSTNFGSVKIEIQQTYSWISSLSSCASPGRTTDYLKCLNNCSSYTTNVFLLNKCINYDIYWNMTTTRIVRPIVNPLNTTMILAYQASNWGKVNSGSGNWSLVTFINLMRRSDNKRINSSPFTTMPPIITLPINTLQIIRIPMIDLDGDIVKCRWAIKNSTYYGLKVDECADVCQNLPGAQLYTSSNLDNNCTLVVNMTFTKFYGVAIQIEDFMPSASENQSLSSIPLQFIVQGINASSDLPRIIGELSNGATITVSANTQFSTSIVAKTGNRQIKITKFSREMLPLGITSTSSIIQLDSTTYSAIFTWIPTIDQIGTKQLYCTIAIDDDNRQSIQYCLNFIVIEKTNSPLNSESTDNSLLLRLSLGLGVPLFLLITLTTIRYGYRKFRRQKVIDIKSFSSVGTTTEDLHDHDVCFSRPISAWSDEFQSNSMTMTRTTFLSSVTKSLTPIDESRLSVWSDD